MHGTVGSLTTGWLTRGILAVYVLALLAAVWVLIDVRRRPDEAFGPLGRIPYVALQGAFLVATLFGVVAGVARFAKYLGGAYGLALLLLMVAAVVQTFVYLLRVAFPKPSEEDAAPDQQATAGQPPKE